MEFDDLLTQDAHEEGAEVRIINPITGELTDVYISVMGPDSKEWRKAMKADTRKILLRKGDVTEDDLIELDVDKLVSITTGWRGIVKDGTELKFSKKECKKLYQKSPRLMDQVDRFVGNCRNFTKG